MAYYFMITKRGNKYTPLDITKSKYFSRDSRYTGMGMSLKEADSFTMMFDDEKELRIALFKEGILEHRNFSSPLSIRFLRNGKYNKVMYDFLYQKDIEYVANPFNIIDKISDKLYKGDYRFVLQYASAFMGYHDCAATASEVRDFADNSIIYNHANRHLFETDQHGDNALERMTKLLIFEYEQSSSGAIEYKKIVKYRNLHAVIAFVNNYEKKYSKEKNNDQLSMFDENKTDVKKKTRKKEKRTSIDGQMNLFD